MLYFSRAKQDPDIIDLEQLAKVREFKKKTFPKALVDTYGDLDEFKDNFSRHIDIQLRIVVAEATEHHDSVTGSSPFTNIEDHPIIPCLECEVPHFSVRTHVWGVQEVSDAFGH